MTLGSGVDFSIIGGVAFPLRPMAYHEPIPGDALTDQGKVIACRVRFVVTA